MTRSQLIERIAHRHSVLDGRDVELAVKMMLEHMTACLAGGGRIEIRGFGSFSLHYPSRAGGAQPEDGSGDCAAHEVRRALQAGQGGCASASTGRVAKPTGIGAARNESAVDTGTRSGRRRRARCACACGRRLGDCAASRLLAGDAAGARTMADARRVLGSVFGFEAFRPSQAVVIEAAARGNARGWTGRTASARTSP